MIRQTRSSNMRLHRHIHKQERWIPDKSREQLGPLVGIFDDPSTNVDLNDLVFCSFFYYFSERIVFPSLSFCTHFLLSFPIRCMRVWCAPTGNSFLSFSPVQSAATRQLLLSRLATQIIDRYGTSSRDGLLTVCVCVCVGQNSSLYDDDAKKEWGGESSPCRKSRDISLAI